MSNASDFVIENGVLKKYVGPGGDVVIPETVEEIGAGAFADNKSISGIQMHNGVHKIEKRAFYNCRSLENIAFSNRLILVGEDAFSFCTKLETLIFPDSLKIPNVDKVLNNCWNLKEIYIPAGAGIEDKKFEKLMGFPWLLKLEGCNQVEKITAPYIPCGRVSEKCILAAVWGYLCNSASYAKEVVEGYQTSFFKIRKKLVPRLLAADNVNGFEILSDLGKITPKNLDGDYLEPALAAGATQCVAFLLNLKNECAVSSQTKTTSKNAPKEVSTKTATTTRDKATKKLWRYELKGGKIRLLEYKGNEQSVTIPAYIEETSVTVIAPGTFVGPHRRGTNQRELAISKIISVTIEEGVREIAGRAFCWCKNLETIRIPKSVKKISAYRFDEARQKLLSDAAFVECPNLTIHAPAGSYAEAYAKEHNIPFVAE